MVLLHGLHGHAHVWDPLSKALSRHYHVVALDMRGHGDSRWSDEMAYQVEDYLADLGAFIGRLGSSPVTLAGESLGGLVAFAYAGVNPTGVDRLVVVDIGPEINGVAIRKMRDSASERPPDFADVADALRWVKGDESPRDDGDLRRIVEHNLTRNSRGRLRWKYDPATDGVISSGDTGDGAELLWPLWKAISAPTLLVRGANSDLLESASAADMVRVGKRKVRGDPECGPHRPRRQFFGFTRRRLRFPAALDPMQSLNLNLAAPCGASTSIQNGPSFARFRTNGQI
ncbi:MAG: alpha/beta hydrolase, partial [Chloroflexi bacterium]|nr:alpha/beta hydrolase [Chloroflexota bacterium]